MGQYTRTGTPRNNTDDAHGAPVAELASACLRMTAAAAPFRQPSKKARRSRATSRISECRRFGRDPSTLVRAATEAPPHNGTLHCLHTTPRV